MKTLTQREKLNRNRHDSNPDVSICILFPDRYLSGLCDELTSLVSMP